MASEQTYEWKGFVFTSEEELAKAKKEAEGIEYMKTKTDIEHSQIVLQLYNRMVEQELFETPIGICYLYELEQRLLADITVSPQDVLPIRIKKNVPASATASDSKIRETKQTSGKTKEEHKKEHKKEHKPAAFRFSVILNIMLAICVIAMFIISLTSGSTTIINYENKIIDKYESWEQQLKDRESKIVEYEKKYNLTNGYE